MIDLLGSSGEDDDDDLPVIPGGPITVNSDDESEDDDQDAVRTMAGTFPADNRNDEAARAHPARERPVDGGMIITLDGEDIFIPDEEPQRTARSHNPVGDTAPLDTREDEPDARDFTVDDCLQHVLEIFPDISHEHVRNLYASFDHTGDFEALAGRARLDNIVEQLVSATSYPKQERGKLKRKRELSLGGTVDVKKWERRDRAVAPPWAKGSVVAICKADFPAIPRSHINERLATHVHLFHTYVALAKDVDDSENGPRAFGRGRPPKAAIADADTMAVNCGHDELVDELAAARLQVVAARAEREAAKAKKRAEDENLQRAIAAGETAECSACFDDLPMNRQIHCNGESAHFTCFDCAETYIKTEVGDSRCRVECPSGCGSGFSHGQLHLLGDKKLLDKLAQIQQEQDIRDAGLEDLEDCPFCDFKAIMPPIEEDFEFRCANPECEKISCRRCKAISHIPLSCEQHAKENKLSSRHQVEEAMTAALVRSCNKCKKQFIKESGCNKMHCTSCNSLQCYVCSATVKDYNHFDQGGYLGRNVKGSQGKKCPLYDNVEERHEREVKEAEVKARAEALEANPDVSAEDLEIKVSDAVKQADSQRIKRAGGRAAFLGDPGVPFAVRRPDFLPPNPLGRNRDRANEDLGEEDLDDIFALLNPGHAPPRRARAAAPERPRQPNPLAHGGYDRLAGALQDVRARARPLVMNPGAPILGGHRFAQRYYEQLVRPQRDDPPAPAAQPLRAYIPVYFGDDRDDAHIGPAQQQPQAQPAAAQQPRGQYTNDIFGEMPNVFNPAPDRGMHPYRPEAPAMPYPPPHNDNFIPNPLRLLAMSRAPGTATAANNYNPNPLNYHPYDRQPDAPPQAFRGLTNDTTPGHPYLPGAWPNPLHIAPPPPPPPPPAPAADEYEDDYDALRGRLWAAQQQQRALRVRREREWQREREGEVEREREREVLRRQRGAEAEAAADAWFMRGL